MSKKQARLPYGCLQSKFNKLSEKREKMWEGGDLFHPELSE